jgi:hypothetical protein
MIKQISTHQSQCSTRHNWPKVLIRGAFALALGVASVAAAPAQQLTVKPLAELLRPAVPMQKPASKSPPALASPCTAASCPCTPPPPTTAGWDIKKNSSL